jgi:pyruvate dehydrogenase E2 component (dihydrolipoamide acetyltransferase)
MSAEQAESKTAAIKARREPEPERRRTPVPEGYRKYRPDLSEKIAPAAPSVRRFAREIGIDIHTVSGSGPRGRISIEDVKKHAREANSQKSKAGAVSTVAVPALPDFSKWGQIERKPMSNIRLKTAQNMSIAWQSVARVTQYDKADITDLEEHRKRFGSKVEVAGGKLTVTAILVKVVASALKTFPQFNSSIDMATNEIIYKRYYHIGVAVDTDRGLLVPVIRDVDKKNILQLSVDLTELAEKARSKKLTLDEMQGGTFTITNLGGIGGTAFSPIVYYPEVAILGISRSSYEPFYVDGKFEPRLMLPLSLSYDHRIIDGADAARFLRWIAEALKDPFLLALEG